jgi:purine-nucleoside phosphorylase
VGEWAKKYFDQDDLPKQCYVFAGTSTENFKQSLLKYFDDVIFHDGGIFEKYMVTKNEVKYLLIFQVFGAPMIIDLVHVLKDGGVEKIIFFGSAYGINDSLMVGDCVIPVNAQSLDGVLQTVENVNYSIPDENLTHAIKNILNLSGEKCIMGKVVSVPSVFVKPNSGLYDDDLDVLEMETACLFYYTKKLNIRSAGILIVSDTINHKLYHAQEKKIRKNA